VGRRESRREVLENLWRYETGSRLYIVAEEDEGRDVVVVVVAKLLLREGGREGGRKGGRKGRREGGRERQTVCVCERERARESEREREKRGRLSERASS
jgi:hypothetical protein